MQQDAFLRKWELVLRLTSNLTLIKISDKIIEFLDTELVLTRHLVNLIQSEVTGKIGGFDELFLRMKEVITICAL